MWCVIHVFVYGYESFVLFVSMLCGVLYTDICHIYSRRPNFVNLRFVQIAFVGSLRLLPEGFTRSDSSEQTFLVEGCGRNDGSELYSC